MKVTSTHVDKVMSAISTILSSKIVTRSQVPNLNCIHTHLTLGGISQ